MTTDNIPLENQIYFLYFGTYNQVFQRPLCTLSYPQRRYRQFESTVYRGHIAGLENMLPLEIKTLHYYTLGINILFSINMKYSET